MKQYSFMTFNALTDSFFLPGNPSFHIRKKAVRQMVQKYQPDGIGVQEINPRMRTELSDAFPGYLSFGESRHARHADEASLILYRQDRFALEAGTTLWLSPHPQKKGSRFAGSQFPRIVTIAHLQDLQDGTKFTFANTHLDANFARIRRKQAEVLLKLLSKYSYGSFTILSGDFNDTEGSPAISLIETEMKDLVQPVLGSTLRGLIGSWRNHQLPIDHIFVSPSISPVSVVKITDCYEGIWPSDHYPVFATISI